jgi:hypothetical protein
MHALGLAQLQKRIKDEAQRKDKLRAREREGALGYRQDRGDGRGEGWGERKVSEHGLRYDPSETLRASRAQQGECGYSLTIDKYLKI